MIEPPTLRAMLRPLIIPLLASIAAAGAIACDGNSGGDGTATPDRTSAITPLLTGADETAIRQMDLENAAAVQESIEDLGGQFEQQNVIYADLTDDGVEEAIVPISSGGTAGNLGFVVLTPAGNEPEELFSEQARGLGGLTLDVEEDGTLLVTEPVFGTDDPECCPSMLRETTYRWNGAALALVDERTVDNPNGQVKPTPSPEQ